MSDDYGAVEKLRLLKDPILRLRNLYVAKWKQLNPNVPINKGHPVIIAGEWVGPGIFKTVALNELPKRIFVIISVSVECT